MPDYINIPDTTNIVHGSLMIVVPGGFVETHGRSRAETMAQQIIDILDNWAENPPRALNDEQRAEFSRLLDFVLRNNREVDVRPTTMGELFSTTSLQPPVDPSVALPDNVGTVIYLNPERNRVEAGTRIYSFDDVYGRGRSGVPIIDIGIPYFDDFVEYGQESLASNLVLAGQTVEGTTSSEGNALAGEVEYNIARLA